MRRSVEGRGAGRAAGERGVRPRTRVVEASQTQVGPVVPDQGMGVGDDPHCAGGQRVGLGYTRRLHRLNPQFLAHPW